VWDLEHFTVDAVLKRNFCRINEIFTLTHEVRVIGHVDSEVQVTRLFRIGPGLLPEAMSGQDVPGLHALGNLEFQI
jgi:hypothetical protein